MQQTHGETLSRPVSGGNLNHKARKVIRRLWKNLATTNLQILALPAEGKEESREYARLAARRNDIARTLGIGPAEAGAYTGEPAKKKKRSRKN